MSKRPADVAFSADPALYAPVSMTTTASGAANTRGGGASGGALRARGVRGGRAPFSVPGHAPAYGRHAVYVAPPTTSGAGSTAAQYPTVGSSAHSSSVRQITSTPAAMSSPAMSGGYYKADTAPAYASSAYAAAGSTSTSSYGQSAYTARKSTATSTKEAESAAKGGKAKKIRTTLRVGGGEVWEDSTLAEWDENDFRIFAGDLGNEVMDEHLAQAFSKYPSMQKARVVRDKRSGKTRGFGFVSFKDPDDFSRALREMNGKYLGNRPLKLRKSNWRDRNVDTRRKKEREAKRLGRKV